jgi:hypothetical protein
VAAETVAGVVCTTTPGTGAPLSDTLPVIEPVVVARGSWTMVGSEVAQLARTHSTAAIAMASLGAPTVPAGPEDCGRWTRLAR